MSERLAVASSTKSEKIRFAVILGAILLANLIVGLLSGFLPKIPLSNFNDSSIGIVDGFSGTNYLLIVNLVVLIISVLFVLFLVFRKFKVSKLICGILVIIVLALFMPITVTHEVGGIGGWDITEYNSFLIYGLFGIEK